MNQSLFNSFKENNLSVRQVADYTTIDLGVIEALLRAEYPMSTGVAELFHGLCDKTDAEWLQICNQHFREKPLTPKSPEITDAKTFIANKAYSQEYISRKKYGNTLYQAIIRYRQSYNIVRPCIDCGIDVYNGRCRDCRYKFKFKSGEEE